MGIPSFWLLTMGLKKLQMRAVISFGLHGKHYFLRLQSFPKHMIFFCENVHCSDLRSGPVHFVITGKSLSEAFILTSTNPQYEKRLFIDLPVQYMKTTSSEHGENMLCAQIVFCFCFDIQNNLCTQHILSLQFS